MAKALYTVAATATGAGSGTILPGMEFANIVSDDIDKIVILPAPKIGRTFTFYAVNQFELRTSSPTTIGINAGTGTDAESQINAGQYVEMICTTLTNWIGIQTTPSGIQTPVDLAT